MRNLDKIYDEGVIQNRFSDLRKLNKKYRSKGPSIYTLRRRVFNSAVGILSLIEEIPFADLSWDLYFLIKDKNFAFHIHSSGYCNHLFLAAAKFIKRHFIYFIYTKQN